jgi:hypothetical protein
MRNAAGFQAAGGAGLLIETKTGFGFGRAVTFEAMFGEKRADVAVERNFSRRGDQRAAQAKGCCQQLFCYRESQSDPNSNRFGAKFLENIRDLSR